MGFIVNMYFPNQQLNQKINQISYIFLEKSKKKVTSILLKF